MADFPENTLSVLDDEYVSQAFMDGVRAGFARDGLVGLTSFDDFGPPDKREELKQIAFARKTILKAFVDPQALDRLGRLRAIADQMSKGNFADAQTRLAELVGLPPIRFQFDFDTAFNKRSVKFFTVELEENPTPGKPPIKKQVPGTIPAYKGPKPGVGAGHRLAVLSELLSKGPEHAFRTNVLQAEIDAGRGRFDEAIRAYDGLLASTPAGTDRRKLVAIRAAFAHLASGDQRFRSERTPGEQTRQAALDRYDRAVRLLGEHGVSGDNPVRQQIEAHAAAARAKLANGLNYLGLRDAFVPNQRFTMLQDAAAIQIQAATESLQSFITFLGQADEKKEKEADLELQRTEEVLNLNILDRQRAIATLNIAKIDEQLSAIEDQQEFLAIETVLGGFRSIVEGAARAGQSPQVGVATSVVGLASTFVNFLEQSEQLAHQKRLAQLDKDIARHQAAIVGTERQISELKLAFFGEKLAFLEGQRLNADVLYELAALNEARAVRQVETAILLAYLFERALNFTLGEIGPGRIQFDYLDRPLGVLDAIKALADDFTLVRNQVDTLLQQEKVNPFVETISLRETYPIQFNRFLQTGEMEFVYSLYQLSKSRPATHRCRLRDIGVEIRGLIPATGFSGILTHSGRFLVRDRDATVDPAVTRLVPTEQQLEEALEEQRESGLAAAVVGGVLYYSLDPESKELSQKTQFVSADPPSEVTLDLFEGIGPTGLWRLEIREHERLAISDVLLHFAVVSRESDPFVLEPRVESLVRSFEEELAGDDALDRIATFSLRREFPDTFFALENGSADLVLTEDQFPRGLIDLQTKMVLAQALDADGKGVPGIALTIGRTDSGFEQAGVTRADGFSDDLDAPPRTLPPDQRVPALGAWQIRLSQPAQFALLGDLRVFFMHTFRERTNRSLTRSA
jgi:hypothetical protein